MVKIISMSLNEAVLQDIDALTTSMGFSGRSETIRAGIRLLSQERKEHARLKGMINGTLSIIHAHKKDMTSLIHHYQDLIVTHLHNHLDKEKCLDIFVLRGDASRIRKLVESFQADKRIEHVKFYAL